MKVLIQDIKSKGLMGKNVYRAILDDCVVETLSFNEINMTKSGSHIATIGHELMEDDMVRRFQKLFFTPHGTFVYTDKQEAVDAVDEYYQKVKKELNINSKEDLVNYMVYIVDSLSGLKYHDIVGNLSLNEKIKSKIIKDLMKEYLV